VLTQRCIHDIFIIGITDDIDIQGAEEIKGIISSLIVQGTYRVILDLEKTQHINYVVIDTLVEGLLRLRKFQGDLRLAGLSDYLGNIFKVAGAGNQFKSYDFVENAVESFKEEEKD